MRVFVCRYKHGAHVQASCRAVSHHALLRGYTQPPVVVISSTPIISRSPLSLCRPQQVPQTSALDSADSELVSLQRYVQLASLLTDLLKSFPESSVRLDQGRYDLSKAVPSNPFLSSFDEISAMQLGACDMGIAVRLAAELLRSVHLAISTKDFVGALSLLEGAGYQPLDDPLHSLLCKELRDLMTIVKHEVSAAELATALAVGAYSLDSPAVISPLSEGITKCSPDILPSPQGLSLLAAARTVLACRELIASKDWPAVKAPLQAFYDHTKGLQDCHPVGSLMLIPLRHIVHGK